MILLQDHIDYLFQIKHTRFSYLTPQDNLFYLDTDLEHELSQLQTKYRLKLNEINEKIEQITEAKLHAERMRVLLETLEKTLQSSEIQLNELIQQRADDNDSLFSNFNQIFEQIEQIQTQLKQSSKILHQIANETYQTKLDSLRSIVNDEYLHFNRLATEHKFYQQLQNNYHELNEQINECIVAIVEYTDNRSRMLTPELDKQRASIDQFVQLNLYQKQIHEQLNLIDQYPKSTSKYLDDRFKQIRNDFCLLKDDIESIVEKENQTIAVQMQLDRIIERFENEFRNQPNWTANLTLDSFDIYEKAVRVYFQTFQQLKNDFEQTIERFDDQGLNRQYANRLNTIDEQFETIKKQIESQIEHLRKGLDEEKVFRKKLSDLIEDLNQCETQLNNRISMKQHQIKQNLQVISIVLLIFNYLFN